MGAVSQRFGLPRSSAIVPRDAAEARAFLQLRLSQVGRTAFLLTFGFWMIQNAVALPRHEFRLVHVLMRGNAYALAAAAVMAAMWLATRSGERSERSLWLIDSSALPLAVAILSLGMVNAPSDIRPDVRAAPQLAASLVGLGVMMFRASLVPSPPARTLLTSIAIGVSPVMVALFADSPGFLVLKVTYIVLWMTVGVTITTMTSGALYGLRAAAQEARRLGQYQLKHRLGAGAMGEVYAAEHAMLRRATAIKLILPTKVDREHVERFEREVQLTALLTHPNTVTIFDYGRTEDGVFYYAMELLDGIDLQRLVDRFGPQPPGRVVALLRQACASLAEAHLMGLVHRDVKPANIMVCRRPAQGEVVKVLDFGVAMLTSGAGAPVRAGEIVGTPLYLAPESIQGDEIGPAADLYALGAVAFWLLAGEPPFSAPTVVELCAAHLHLPPPSLSERSEQPVPSDLEALVLSCLAKAPTDRPPSALALERALAACDVEPFDPAEEERFWQRYRPEAQEPMDERPLNVTLASRAEATAPSRRDA